MDEPKASIKSSKTEVEERELVEDVRPSSQVENDGRIDSTNRTVISGGSVHSSNVAETVNGGMNNTVTTNNFNIYCPNGSGVCIEHSFPADSGITNYEVAMSIRKREKKQTPSTIRQDTADEIQEETEIFSTAIQEESAVAANHSSTEMVVNTRPDPFGLVRRHEINDAAFIDENEVDGFVSIRLRDNVKVTKSTPEKTEAADLHNILGNEDPKLCVRAKGGTSISVDSNQSQNVGNRSLLTEDTEDMFCSPGTTTGFAKSVEYSLQNKTRRPRNKSFTDFRAFLDGLHDLPCTVHSRTEENVINIVKLASKCPNSKLIDISTFIRRVLSSPKKSHPVNNPSEQNSTGTSRKSFIDFRAVSNELDSLSDEVRTITDQNMVRVLEIANADPCKLHEVSDFLEKILLGVGNDEVHHSCVII